MKRTALLTLLAALFAFGAAGWAAAEDCACRKPPTVSSPAATDLGALRQGIETP